MESFYGGRQGKSFILVDHFDTIADMEECFAAGGSTTDRVNYGEYVIIDTIINRHDKQDLDNGKVYMRKIDNTAEYIGQIVGPQGNCPIVDFQEFNDPNHYLTDGTQISTIPNTGLVPGKDSAGNYNDSVTTKWGIMRDKYNNVIGCYIGLKFPYLVEDYTATSVSAYVDASIDKIEDEHPFYKKWRINVPKGIKGDAVTGVETVINSGKQYYRFTITNYDNSTPTTKTVDFDYNIISNITVADNGTLTISLTCHDDIIFSNRLRWIDQMALSDSGILSVKYNNIDSSTNINQSNPIRWVNNMNIAADGKVSTTYNTSTTPVIINNDNPIKWIESMSFAQNGQVSVKYNTQETATIVNNENPILWIAAMSIDDEGHVVATMNDNSEKKSTGHLKWFDNVTLAADGTLTFVYHNSEDGNVTFSKAIKWISSIKINTGDSEGEGNQKLNISYNNGTNEDIGNPINYIMEAIVSQPDVENSTAEPYHLLILYADPAYRAALTSPVSYPSQKFNTLRTDWFDAGMIRGEKGEVTGIVPNQIISESADSLVENGILLNTTTIKHA